MLDTHCIFSADIVESLERIEKYLSDITFEQFSQNEELQDAVMRRVQIIGDAAKKIPKHIKKQHHAIPWSLITATRNEIVHDYADIDTRLLWTTATVELPPLLAEFRVVHTKLESSLHQH